MRQRTAEEQALIKAWDSNDHAHEADRQDKIYHAIAAIRALSPPSPGTEERDP